MTRKYNRVCVICGEKYSYCSHCGEDSNKPIWMADFESENCKNIYESCAGYNMGNITVSEARDVLSKCDLSKKEKFSDATKKAIVEIMGETKSETVEKTIKTKEVQSIKVENTDAVKKEVVNNVEPKTDNSVVSKQTNYTNKKRTNFKKK